MEYEWDPAKAKANLRKHGTSFADAALALEDPRALTMADPDAGASSASSAWVRIRMGACW